MPTLSTTPIPGGAIAASAAMLPGRRADISSTRKRCSRGGAQHGPRVAELVVERPGRGHHLAERREHRGEQVLRRRLARRAGDPDDRQPAGHQLGGHRRGQLGQRGQHRRARTRRCRLEHTGRRAAGRRAGDDDRRHTDRPGASTATAPAATADAREVVPVERAPGSARNNPPGARPRVELDGPGDAVRGGIGGSASTPPTISAISARLRRSSRCPRPRARRRARRGRRTGGARRAVWPVSCPLPAISTTSPGPAHADGGDRRRAGRRSRPPGRSAGRGGAAEDRARGSPPDPRCAGCRR